MPSNGGTTQLEQNSGGAVDDIDTVMGAMSYARRH